MQSRSGFGCHRFPTVTVTLIAPKQALLVRSLVDAARGRDYTPQGNSQEVHSDGAVYTMLLTGKGRRGWNGESMRGALALRVM